MRERNRSIPYPKDNSYTEWLRYLVLSAPDDAPELLFLASLWIYALRHDGLTDKQSAALEPYLAEAAVWIKIQGRQSRSCICRCQSAQVVNRLAELEIIISNLQAANQVQKGRRWKLFKK